MYKDSRGFTDTHDNQKDFNERFLDSDPGPYLGTVKFTEDPERMGRLGVNIPALSGTTSPKPEQITWCQYLSPFYGAKPAKAIGKDDPYNYNTSQTSYGMWAVPPDIDTSVLVIFAKGDKNRMSAFWIGCVQEPLVNQQIPGHAARTETAPRAGSTDYDSQTKQEQYGTDFLPAGERNRLVNEGVRVRDQKFPINERLAEQLRKQGLIQDPERGTTSSSARRETPSAVFGITTPGRIKSDSAQPRIGLDNRPVRVDRDHGHSFVMDDGAANGTNQLVRMRSASGHQILMHDTAGVIYISNASGNAWLEMDREGRIDVFSGVGGINLRSQGDFNLHSDTNINMHAGGQIRMSSSNDIIQSAGSYMMTMGEKGIFNSSQKGSIRDYAKDGISSFTPGTQLHGSLGVFHLAGSQVHFNSTSASSTWGPKWLKPDYPGININEREELDVETAKKDSPAILKRGTKKTKTTVHRFVTHEPMARFRGFTTEGALPIDGADNVKQWFRLASSPGTNEYMEQKNRLSPIESVRLGQYQADAERYLKEKMGVSTDSAKAKQLLQDFGAEYDKLFDIQNQAQGAFDTALSISNKLKDFDVNNLAKDVAGNLANQLSNQVIDNFTGKEATALFKDNVFVNQAGELFTIGDTSKILAGDIKGFATDVGNNVVQSAADKAFNALTKKKAIGVDKFGNTIYERSGLPTNIGGLDISGITGTVDIRSIKSLTDIKTTTNVFKNVVAGQVTSAVTSTALSAVKAQASGFLAGLGGATARDIAMGGGSVTGFASIGVKIGALALPKLLGGGTVGKAVSRVFSKFSDRRLKEDIRLVGRSPSGINIYSFKYYQIPGRYIGVMAQEVPWARHMTDSGYWAVDYSKVDVEFRRLH